MLVFTEDERNYILRQIANNQIVLFLGAGFSYSAKNRLGTNFPIGNGLSEKLWTFLEYEGEYDGTSLTEMYESFLDAPINKHKKKNFLEENLLSSNVPENYNVLGEVFWYKIYTTNVDDILDLVFKRLSKRTKSLVFPKDEYSERDQSLMTLQTIYLNGKLPCNPEELIFSSKQYAKASLVSQPLYSQFVYDYVTLPTIFLGTNLNEPLFERYIEAREGKEGYREQRPKSFLIAPTISPVKQRLLKTQYNVHFIKGTADDFLAWLRELSPNFPNYKEVLGNAFPSLLHYIELAELAGIPRESLSEFAKSFKRIPVSYSKQNERSAFLLGASPSFGDIFSELDVPRNITKSLFDEVESAYLEDSNKLTVISLIGSAGSGKSTILKRLGVNLSQNGRTTFLSYSDFLCRNKHTIEVLGKINNRVVFLFDNTKNIVGQLSLFLEEVTKNGNKLPIVILASRSNYYNKLRSILNVDFINHIKFSIPDLEDNEIELLINKLDSNNLLGVLKGMSDEKRFQEFKYRARKQILIAMKEATNGKPFGEIIESEFNGIEPHEAKVVCTCIALCSELGFTNSKQDLVGFSKVTHQEALNYLETTLAGTIIWTGNNNKRFMLRHRLLADYIIKNCADTETLHDAYIRVLSVLAPELKRNHGPSKKFNLYKNLINHEVIAHRFNKDIARARKIYNSIAKFFSNDSQFWLQYGSLEVECAGGDLNLALNYLNQADSLSPDHSFIRTAKCNLFYIMAREEKTLDKAIELRNKANELAFKLILEIGAEVPLIYNIHSIGTYNFIKKWITDPVDKAKELKHLKSTILTAISLHPKEGRLTTILDAIKRAYFQLGIKGELEDPEIPNFSSN